MKQWIKAIQEKPFWVNFLAVVGLGLTILFLFFLSLDFITGHGETQTVPNVLGKTVQEAIQQLEAKGFDVAIQDSIYVDSLPKLAIVKQSPDADAVVKANRTVYLTINRAVAPQIEMPNLVGFSLKSAQMYLQTLNLKLGDTTYKPDIAKNAVLEQLYNGYPIKPGTLIPMSSSISLVLGNGLGSGQLVVPDLIGYKFSEAKNLLQSISINLGALVVDSDVIDSANAYVYKQNPNKFIDAPTGERITNKIKPGQVIDLWIGTKAPIKDSSQLSNDYKP